jgi:hypothetical protein
MFSGISILNYNIDDIAIINDEARRSVSSCNRRVLAKCKLGQDGRDEGIVMRDSVEHCPVGAVVHGVEGDFKLDRLGRSGLSHNDDGDDGRIVHVVVLVHKPVIGQWRGGVVSDGGCDVCTEVRKNLRNCGKDVLGFKVGGTTSNMSVSMLAWITQLEEVSLRAVTRIEYRWATVRAIKSIGYSSTSVCTQTLSRAAERKNGDIRRRLR